MLLNNAAVGAKGTSWEGLGQWQKVFEVNVFGCVRRRCCVAPH